MAEGAWVPRSVKNREDHDAIRFIHEMDRIGKTLEHGPPDGAADLAKKRWLPSDERDLLVYRVAKFQS